MTSHDIPLRGRPVDPTSLEALGKQAAHVSETSGLNMTDAVVQTVGHVKLNSQQVRRVVEFANIEMFNRKFASISGSSRSVHIDGGPADPVEVMQTLNDAARPREVVMDSLEYSMPPSFSKHSSAEDFGFVAERTRTGALGEVYSLRSKLSAAHDELIQNVEASKGRVAEAYDDLVEAVKSASAAGAAPEELFWAWSAVHPELAKTIYTKLASAMRTENTKVAGRRLNPETRVVSLFTDLTKHASSAAAHAAALKAVEAELNKVSVWLKKHGG